MALLILHAGTQLACHAGLTCRPHTQDNGIKVNALVMSTCLKALPRFAENKASVQASSRWQLLHQRSLRRQLTQTAADQPGQPKQDLIEGANQDCMYRTLGEDKCLMQD